MVGWANVICWNPAGSGSPTDKTPTAVLMTIIDIAEPPTMTVSTIRKMAAIACTPRLAGAGLLAARCACRCATVLVALRPARTVAESGRTGRIGVIA